MKKTLLSSLMIAGLLAGCGGGGGAGNPGNTSGTNTPAAVPVAYLYGLGPSSTSGNVLIAPILSTGLEPSGGTITSATTGAGPQNEVLVTIGSNHYLYVDNSNGGQNNQISMFQVNQTTVTSLGTVTAASDLSDANGSMAYANGVLYVALFSGAISSYAVNADGTLSLLNAAAYTLPNANNPDGIAVDQSKKYLIVSEFAGGSAWNAISLTIEAGGLLTFNSQATLSSGGEPLYPFLPDPNTSSGEFLYAFGPTGLYLETLSASGTITITENTAIQPSGSNQLGVAWIDPTGTYLYVSNFDETSNSDSLSQYLINADGSVTPGSAPTIQLSSGGIGGNGGNNLYPGFYDTADGILMIGYGHSFATFEYNALNGSLKTLSLDAGYLFDGVLVGY